VRCGITVIFEREIAPRPLVGMNVLVLKAVLPDVPIVPILKGLIPVIAVDFLRLALWIAFLSVTLWPVAPRQEADIRRALQGNRSPRRSFKSGPDVRFLSEVRIARGRAHGSGPARRAHHSRPSRTFSTGGVTSGAPAPAAAASKMGCQASFGRFWWIMSLSRPVLMPLSRGM
jgi:hypothetical protein